MKRLFFIIIALGAAGSLAAGGCASGDAPLGVVDPQAAPATPTFEQAFGIVQRECAPCHDQGGVVPRLDTCEGLLDNLGAVAFQALENSIMPPGAWPRLTSEERLLLTRWIAQGAEAPCE